ncbi:MAG TPA: efflux RND transporter periplasmic adaptor subunit [Planctomycetaceae bacterium]|jgi:cobalt-zinc-cadmium efflux system membrane fusion protein|nr:efflux RND transporter periplasmic adaptor subunit [Planctomycetaceae bacterium]
MSSGLDPVTLLVVEDDPVLSQVLGQTLAKDGYVIRHAATAAEAEREVADRSPRLVLLDTCLREGTGLQLAETIRAGHAGLPVILLTAGAHPAGEFPGWSTAQVLSKSTDLSKLRETVAAGLAGELPSRPAAAAKTAASAGQRQPLTTQPERALSYGKEPSMRLLNSKFARYAAGLVVVLLIVATIGAANGALKLPGKEDAASEGDSPRKEIAAAINLVPNQPHTLFLPTDVRAALGIRKDNIDQIVTAAKPTRTRPLLMPGTTMLDPTRLLPVRALFAPSPSSAQVVEIGTIEEDRLKTGATSSHRRELRSGDKVTKGNLLAVFYSVEVGNKKNDLIDATYQFKFDSQVLKRWEANSAVVPDYQLWQQRKAVQADVNAINRAVSTLRTWGIPEEDIQAVRDEAEHIKPEDAEKRLKQRDRANFDRWARVEIKAPDDGIIVERNITAHTVVSDNTLNLFQIAKLDEDGGGPRLYVVGNCPEDDLSELQALPERARSWTITTAGSQPMKGYIDDISYIIDPNDHTVKVKGHIDNKEGRLLAGKMISAKVELPPPADVVEVPTDAVVDDGQQSIVFVQTDAEKQYYTMRRVELVGRFDHTLFVRDKPFTKAEERTAEEAELGMLPKQPLSPGERILRTGVGELKIALLDLESQPRQKSNKGE